MESEIDHTRALFKKAQQWVDEHGDIEWWRESVYGKYAAVLMMERAEAAEAALAAAREAGREEGRAEERERTRLSRDLADQLATDVMQKKTHDA